MFFHIAILVKSGTLSGAEKRCGKIVRALNARGHRAVLFMDVRTYGVLTCQGYRFDWPPVVVYRHPAWFRWLARGKGRFAPLRHVLRGDAVERWARQYFWRRLLRSHGIDLVHVFMDWAVLRDLPVPHLFEITSPDLARFVIGDAARIPEGSVLHPNSESVDAVLAGSFSRNCKIVAPLAYFDPQEPPGFQPPRKENLVVFGHRLIPRKNPVIFARAAKRFVAARPDWRVAIRGVGPLVDDVRAVVAEEIAAGRVQFGFHPNLMDELYSARVFVSIESEDNYSNQSVLEAMWCRNALVLSDRGRTRARYFADNGIMCQPEEESVLDALLALAADPVRLDQFAANARLHVETAFNRNRYLDHLESVYRTVKELKYRGGFRSPKCRSVEGANVTDNRHLGMLRSPALAEPPAHQT